MPAPRAIAVVGASLAGLRAAEALRRLGHDGPLALIGAETHLPYDRPPLSKEVLRGDAEPDALALRRAPYDELDLELRLGRRAVSLDARTRTVIFDDGTSRAFDGLVLATGSAPRVPRALAGTSVPGAAPLDGLHTLRTVEDCLALRARLDAGARLCVVGGGFIGAEVAATCRRRGNDVTVVEALAEPMAGALGPTVGAVLAGVHRDHGVDLRCGAAVAAVEGDGRVERVRLADGAALECDALLVAVGAAPVTGWLGGSGLALDDGVVCDASLRAAPGIVAAGDLCRWPHDLYGGARVRIEHWTNAGEQGAAAAARLLADLVDLAGARGAGPGEPFATVPFVWSDQYDLKVQVVGLVPPGAEPVLVHGRAAERRFVALYERDGRLAAACALARPRQLMGYRRMLLDRAPFADALAAAADAA